MRLIDLGVKFFHLVAKILFFFQYSSSIILGSESTDKYEQEFLEKVFYEIQKGATLYHVTSIEGLNKHFFSEIKRFPNINDAINKLSDSNGCVELYTATKHFAIRKIEESEIKVQIIQH